jgi:hypothetical protein
MKMSRRPLLALLPLVVSVSGCFSWGTYPTPAPSSSQRLPDPVLLTRHDQSRLILHEAMVYGDSIVGYEGPETLPTTVALSDVRTMQARKKDYPRTRILAAGITVAAVLLYHVREAALVIGAD